MENRVSEAKRLLGLNSTELGEKVGVHRTTIERWEKNPNSIKGPASRVLDQLVETHRHSQAAE